MPRLTSLLVDWLGLNSGDCDSPVQAYADALLRASQELSDDVLRRLPATPDDAAAALADAPFADRVEGIFLPWDWFEPYCAAVRLPMAELDDGWDISDGDDVYWCPRVDLADDPDSPQDTRPFVRVDQIRSTAPPA